MVSIQASADNQFYTITQNYTQYNDIQCKRLSLTLYYIQKERIRTLVIYPIINTDDEKRLQKSKNNHCAFVDNEISIYLCTFNSQYDRIIL